MLGQRHATLIERLVCDGTISCEPSLPTIFKHPLLARVVPPRAFGEQPARDAERLAREVQHIQPRKGVRRRSEVSIVEDSRFGPEYPLVRGLIKRLRWFLPLANQVTQVVLPSVCEWQYVVLIHEHE